MQGEPEKISPSPFIFNLYPEHVEAIQALADAKYRHNRSEALRQMIEYASANLFPALGIKPTPPADTVSA